MDDNVDYRQQIADKLLVNTEIVGKLSINDDFVDKMATIMLFLNDHPHSSTDQITEITGKSVSRTKNYMQALVQLGLVIAEGGNRNRT